MKKKRHDIYVAKLADMLYNTIEDFFTKDK